MDKESEKFVEKVLNLFAEKIRITIFFGDESSDAIKLGKELDKLIGQATDEELKNISKDSLFKTNSEQVYKDLVKRRERNRIH